MGAPALSVSSGLLSSASFVGSGGATSGLIRADVLVGLAQLPDDYFQVIVADPPYGNVLTSTGWDAWPNPEDYYRWSEMWVRLALRKLRPDGLMFVFGQVGQREHRWIFLCPLLCRLGAFHDQLIWDRVVGYNDRRDSFTPAYEMCLVLRRSAGARPYFNKDAARRPYDAATITRYLRDKRYKDPVARLNHLQRGKYCTNLIAVPSLKGSSREKVGHPSQKPLRLIEILLEASSRPGDPVLDPFLGSGTTAVACEQLGRPWTGIEVNPDYCAMAEARIAGRRNTV